MPIVHARVRIASAAMLAGILLIGLPSSARCRCVPEFPSATRTETRTPTPTPSLPRASCIGDCNGDDVVTVPEIVTGVNVALDRAEISACPAFACNGPDIDMFINCGVGAVRNALNGCPMRTPTATPVGFVRYRLQQRDSLLMRNDAYPGPIIQTMSWPMSGTLDVIATEPAEENQVFHFTITSIQFEAAEHTVIGDNGEIAVRDGTERVAMTAIVAIDGESVEVGGDLPVSVLSDSYPPDLVLEACGAPGRSVSCATLNSGGDSGYRLIIRAIPEADQTPLPTRTPTPTVSVIYELVEGSTILMALPTPGSSPIVEPLSGTFVGRVDCGDPVACVEMGDPNTLLAMAITSIEFHSPHYTVTGTGGVHVLTFDFLNALVGGNLVIAGQSIGVHGGGGFDGSRFPPSFPGLEICGGASNQSISCDAIRNGVEGGYVLMIFAVPRQ